MFRGAFRMNESCPVCGLKFERERGYFTGAMYVSYALTLPALSVFTAVLWHLVVPEWPLIGVLGLATFLFLPLVPPAFRYSRVIWIHLDRYLDP